MNEDLYLLRKAIDSVYTLKEEAAKEKIRELIAAAALNIKEKLASVYRSEQNDDVLNRYFSDCLHELTFLSDEVYASGRTGTEASETSVLLLQHIDGVIIYIRNRFPKAADPELIIPQSIQHELVNEVKEGLHKIRKGLENKQADKKTAGLIMSSLNGIIHPAKPHRLQWKEYDFMRRFIRELLDFSADKRLKDYRRRLQLMLFRTNFNHPGFYRYLHETFERSLNGKSHTEKLHLINKALLEVEQIDEIPGLACMHEHRSLKTFCLEWLQKRKEAESEWLTIENLAGEYLEKNRFKTPGSVTGLSIWLHYIQNKGQSAYPTFRELAKAFCLTHCDNNGNSFHETTLSKKPDRNAVTRFYKSGKDLLEALKREYDL